MSVNPEKNFPFPSPFRVTDILLAHACLGENYRGKETKGGSIGEGWDERYNRNNFGTTYNP